MSNKTSPKSPTPPTLLAAAALQTSPMPNSQIADFQTPIQSNAVPIPIVPPTLPSLATTLATNVEAVVNVQAPTPFVLTGEGSPGTTVDISLNGQSQLNTTVGIDGKWRCTLPKTIATGFIDVFPSAHHGANRIEKYFQNAHAAEAILNNRCVPPNGYDPTKDVLILKSIRKFIVNRMPSKDKTHGEHDYRAFELYHIDRPLDKIVMYCEWGGRTRGI
jgi:hypothetical protein